MEKYDEKTADKKLAALVEGGPEGFCPLIRAECREDCVSFAPPRKEVVADRFQEGVQYYVLQGYCMNKMMGG